MISITNIDLKELKKKLGDNKVTCGICGEKFAPEDMTGKTVGIWFVICCEKCKRKEQAIGRVVYDPNGRIK